MGTLTASRAQTAGTATKVRLATVWLGGCSGCHMSFLDTDEWLIDLAQLVDVVYSPIADVKVFPENVDITLVEGAVANEDHLELVHQIRERSKVVVSFGDCAVTGNVTAMRNPLGKASSILQYVYVEAPKLQGPVPNEPGIVPVLLDRVEPVHEVIDVDFYIPGCPPPAARIREALEQALETHCVHLTGKDLKFG